MKNQRAKGIKTLSALQKSQSTLMIENLLVAKVNEKSRADNALNQMEQQMANPGSRNGMEDEYGNIDPTVFNLNNASIFRTMDEKKKTEKYTEICEKLSKSCIKSVLLANANIGDLFIEKIASMLKKNTTITEINLNSNPISSSGVIHLCEALKV